MQSFLLLFLITINFLESNCCKKYISRTYMSKRLRFNGRSGRKNNFEIACLCQTDCPGQDVPNHALSLTGQIFAWKILLSRIFRFFWLCSSRKEKRLRWLQRNEGRNEGREDKSYLRRSWAQSAKKSASPCLRYSCLPNDQSITQIEKIIFLGGRVC